MKHKINLSLLIFAAVLFLTSCSNKIAYIDIDQVFNEFLMKEELGSDLKKVQNGRDAVLDSMKLELQKFYGEIENSKKEDRGELILSFQKKERAYYEMAEDFKARNQELTDDYDVQIFARINTLVKQYGDDNKYTIILGANSTGNIMYAQKSANITDDVILYINRKYEDE